MHCSYCMELQEQFFLNALLVHMGKSESMRLQYQLDLQDFNKRWQMLHFCGTSQIFPLMLTTGTRGTSYQQVRMEVVFLMEKKKTKQPFHTSLSCSKAGTNGFSVKQLNLSSISFLSSFSKKKSKISINFWENSDLFSFQPVSKSFMISAKA